MSDTTSTGDKSPTDDGAQLEDDGSDDTEHRLGGRTGNLVCAQTAVIGDEDARIIVDRMDENVDLQIRSDDASARVWLSDQEAAALRDDLDAAIDD